MIEWSNQRIPPQELQILCNLFYPFGNIVPFPKSYLLELENVHDYSDVLILNYISASISKDTFSMLGNRI